MYLEDIFVVGASLAGLPALSLPSGLVSGLPIAGQLIAPRFGEAKLFAAAKFLEEKNKINKNNL